MLHNLRLENFGKHEDITVQFTPGINAIRATVEAGKSTLLKGIAYAFYGTKALSESLEDTVTYTVPVARLKVTLDFSHLGVAYTIWRKKSGAELSGPGIKVTGQTEVTKFVENLFEVSADMASKLMMAKQKDLGGALVGGPSTAGKMIEDLADVDLIQNLIDLIGEKLLAGHTAAAEARVEAARGRVVTVEASDLAAEKAAVIGAELQFKTFDAETRVLTDRLESLDVQAANRILADDQRLRRASEARFLQTCKLEQILAQPLPIAPAPAEIEKMRTKIEAQKLLAAAEKLHQELQAAKVEVLWDQPMEALTAEMIKTEAGISAGQATYTKLESQHADVARGLSQVQHAAQVRLAQLEGKLVKEESCTFCGKDLKDIPEVARVNNPLTKEIAEVKQALETAKTGIMAELNTLGELLSDCQDAIRTDTVYRSQLDAVVKRQRQLFPLYTRAEAFISLDTSTVPAMWTWTGPTDEPQTFDLLLQTLEEAAAEAIRAAATRVQQEKQLAELLAQDVADKAIWEDLPIKDAQETLEEAAELQPKVSASFGAAQATRDRLAAFRADLQTKEALQARAAQQQVQSIQELKDAEADLVEMQANNALVKKLRAVKPKITDQLWSIVLGAVSVYFSQVRGERSIITRSDNGFRTNGHPVSGLSGSAEDVLGLAIRFALTKTFLGNVGFVILDEPAAACNDERETAMLGLLATAGFTQTILVTHSPLADAFADNIITL